MLMLSGLAIACFIVHVLLLFTSFPASGFLKTRYLYSHITLWMAGTLLFILAWLYAGKGYSDFLDFFDTPLKKAAILLVTVLLSVVAHSIVRSLMGKLYARKRS